MRKKALIGCLLVTAALVLTVHAGWVRSPGTRFNAGNTRWNPDFPSPVTLWQRNQNDDLYPTPKPVVFNETMEYYDATGSNKIVNTGIWMWDANKDVYINPEATGGEAYGLDTANLNPWYDVEFRVDANGDVYARN
jgi:hypothetical protein